MKNKIFIAGLFFVEALLFSCKDKTAFTIAGQIKNPSTVKTIYLQQLDSSSFITIDSATLNANGEFKFKRSTPYASLFKLVLDTTSFNLIAQNGDAIELNTDLNNKGQAYIIKGSQASDDLKTINNLAKSYSDENDKLQADFDTKTQQSGAQPDSLLKIYTPIFQKNQATYSAKVLAFANEHKNSLVGFYAITSLDAVKFEQQLVAYADDLKGDITQNPSVKLFIAAIAKAKPLSIGHQAPNFASNTIDNKQIKLSDFKGKYVMVDFWASWCVPCRQENPNVVKQYAFFKDKSFNVLSISLDTDKAAWQKAVTTDHLSWTQASDLDGFQGAVETLYHIEAIPTNFIIDPQGRIIAKNFRGVELEDFLKQTFKN